jgi:putative transposase
MILTRAQKLMQLHGIRAKGKRRFKVITDSKHDLPIAPNLLDRQFNVAELDKVWAGDHGRRLAVPGRGDRPVQPPGGGLVAARGHDARCRHRCPAHGLVQASSGQAGRLIFHSDRGSQYASKDFRDVLSEYGFTASMSQRGDCWDNACSETLFGSLRAERLHGQRFVTTRQAKDETMAWLLWFNQTRLHSTLAYVSPVQFEQD